MPYVRDVRPLVTPAEGDGDLRPRTIAGVGDGVFYVDDEHPAGGKLPISSALGGSEVPENGGDHFVMILEGIVVVPRWSAASCSVVIVVIWLFSLELFSQVEAVLHLVLVVLMEMAWALKDLFVLLIVVELGARFVNGGDHVVWSAAAILTRFGPFWPIMTTVLMVAAVTMASFVRALIAAMS